MSISFKADKQVQAKTIEVTYDAPDVPSCGVPTFSVEGGTYKEAQAIELRAGEGGEKVFYTINDGTEQQYIEQSNWKRMELIKSQLTQLAPKR